MRFDRQVLYLFFLFGSTHAAPAHPVTTAVPPSPTPLLNDPPPSLRLDISPELVSSVADFASQVVSAVFAEESTNSLRSSSRHVLDDESTSSDSYPPVALQTTRIATPSVPKNPAVESSTSTSSRRSRTRLLSTLPTAPVSTSSTSARPTTHSSRPHSSSRTPEHQHISSHQATRSHPANTHAVSAQPFHNSTRLNTTMNQDSEPANMTGATTTDDGLGNLFTAIGQVGALSGSDPASVVDEPTPTNALDVLISALPSNIASSIRSEYSDIIDPIGSAVNSVTNAISGAGDRTSQTRTRTPPTTSRSPTSTSLLPTTTPTSTPVPLPPPTSTNETPMSTMVTRPSDTDTAPASATTTRAPPSAANPSENASTIGIATGVASGVVLLCLGGLYLWRRRQQGKAPFARSGSKRSNGVYPEVAWLYDPDITPPRSRAGSEAGAQLIPAPRPGSVEIGGTPVMGSRSPEMRPANPSSPLLAPVVRGSRDMTGSRSRSGSEVDFDRLRPLSTLREETPRGSMS